MIKHLAGIETSLIPRSHHLFKWAFAAFTVGSYHTVTGASGDLVFNEEQNDTTVTLGEELVLVVEVEGSKLLRPKTWVVEGDLPAGVTHDIRQDLGIVLIFGTPTETGTFPIVVKAWELANMLGDEGKPLAFNIVVEPLGPVFTTQPTSQNLTSGDTLTLSAAVDTQEGVTYQWQWSSDAESEFQDVPGGNSSTLSIANILSSQAGFYRVIATNLNGPSISDVAIVSVEVPLPVFTLNLLDQTINIGQSLTLSTLAEGPEGISYQWERRLSGESEFIIMEGEMGSSLTINNIQLGDQGSYRVIATNPGGSVNSQTAVVTVLEESLGPKFTLQPIEQSPLWGEALNLSAAVENPESAAFQWQRLLLGAIEYEDIEGEIETTLTIDRLLAADVGLYRLKATDSEGSNYSNAVLVSVTSTAYQAWSEAVFSDPFSPDTDMLSDPDFDSLNNGFEFAFGLDPQSNTAGPILDISQEDINGVAYSVFKYPNVPDPGTSIVSVERNLGLIPDNWTEIQNGENGVIIENQSENYVIKTPTVPLLFIRLRIAPN